MRSEDIVQEAEDYLVRGEKSGLAYPDVASRAQAKLALIESMTKDAKADNIPEGATASESGSVVGASGGAGDLASINAELDRLRQLPQDAEVMRQRQALTRKQKEFHAGVDPSIMFSE